MTTITTEDKERIYHAIIHNGQLTTKILHECGFSDKRIRTLLKEKVLIRVKIGHYELWSTGALYLYSVEALKRGYIEEALLCYEYYYRTSSFSPIANFAKFACSIIRGNLDNLEQYMDVFMCPTISKNLNKDYNFFLFMLSYIIELREDYKTAARSIDYNDIAIPLSRLDRSTSPLRVSIYYNQDFHYAKRFLKEKNSNSLNDILTQYLIEHAIQRIREIEKQIHKLIEDKDYEGLVLLLKSEEESHKLRVTWKIMLCISKDIFEMQETGVPSVSLYEETNDIYRLVQLKDYEQAQKKNKCFSRIKKIVLEYNDIATLLSDAIECRKRLSLNSPIEHKIDQTPPPLENIPISEMISTFRMGQIEEGFQLLKSIIYWRGLTEYSYLLIGQTEICLNEKDVAFTKPLITLSALARGAYPFDFDCCIEEFHYFLENRKFESARACLNIIRGANRHGHIEIPKAAVSDLLITLSDRLNKDEHADEKSFQNKPKKRRRRNKKEFS